MVLRPQTLSSRQKSPKNYKTLAIAVTVLKDTSPGLCLMRDKFKFQRINVAAFVMGPDALGQSSIQCNEIESLTSLVQHCHWYFHFFDYVIHGL
jgi:hypothetical protein